MQNFKYKFLTLAEEWSEFGVAFFEYNSIINYREARIAPFSKENKVFLRTRFIIKNISFQGVS